MSESGHVPSPKTEACLNIARVEMGAKGVGEKEGMKEGKLVRKRQKKNCKKVKEDKVRVESKHYS